MRRIREGSTDLSTEPIILAVRLLPEHPFIRPILGQSIRDFGQDAGDILAARCAPSSGSY